MSPSSKLPTVYQNLIHCSRYAKWIPTLKRRETWHETVKRTSDYLFKNIDNPKVKDRVYSAILHQEVMPSMRLMMTSGKAHEQENIGGYNCCYLPIDCLDSIPEILYILMNGTGVGFSVESQYTKSVPPVPHNLLPSDFTIYIEDNKLGWAQALKLYLNRAFFKSELVKLDYSKIRIKGKRLKTMGGYASGPEPLIQLFEFLDALLLKNKGKKLKPIDFHSIVCKTASIVVVGGVRRSALISLSDLDDTTMAKAKSGDWWIDNNHYALANNSAVYTKKPTVEKYLEEATTIYKSFSGERGFFNRDACNKKAVSIGRDTSEHFGCNPCSEIILKAKLGPQGGGQFCNLSEVIVRPYDTLESIKDKLEIATIIGTIQSTYTKFKFLRPGFQQNTEEERLLGVSMTGVFDNLKLLNATPEELMDLRQHCREINVEWSTLLGINPSVAITAIKPSGTVSALNDTASGLHARYSKFYFRRVRLSKTDPICEFLKDAGVDNEVDFYNKESLVFTFPMKAPQDAITTETLSALDHYKYWLKFNEFYCDHKVSVTINYTPEEYLQLIPEIYKTWDKMSGISLLPRSEHTYKQAPFEACSEEQFLEMNNKYKVKFNDLDFQDLRHYEKENKKKIQVELSCSAGSCEITSL